MIKGANPVRSKSGGVVIHYGKWVGSDAPANGLYTPVANSAANGGGPVCKGLTLTRTGAGLYTIACVDGGVPHFLPSRVTVRSATLQQAFILTTTAATGLVTIAIRLASNSATASDPVAADFIDAEIVAAAMGNP